MMIKPSDILEAPEVGTEVPEKEQSPILLVDEDGQPKMMVMQTNEHLYVQDENDIWWEPLIVDGVLYKVRGNYNVRKP